MSQREDSLRIARILAGVYESLGVSVTWLSCAPLGERVDAVLEGTGAG
jgi:predicted ATPase